MAILGVAPPNTGQSRQGGVGQPVTTGQPARNYGSRTPLTPLVIPKPNAGNIFTNTFLQGQQYQPTPPKAKAPLAPVAKPIPKKVAKALATPPVTPVKTPPVVTPVKKGAPAAATNSGKGGVPPPTTTTKTTKPNPTEAGLVKQITTLMKQLGLGGVHVPAAISLAHIAALTNGLPTSPNVPGWDSLASIKAAMTPSAQTPGYVNPGATAAAAAQQGYGAAIAGDQGNITQQTAQNKQDLTDIQNWYNALTGIEQQNAQSDAGAFNAATQSTGALGGAVSSALGFAGGSAGADQIGQAGSILNAGAVLNANAGEQADRSIQSASGLAGLQDLRNQVNLGNQALVPLRTQLNQDQKSKGAAYTTALGTAKQSNATDANAYASALQSLHNNYDTQFQNVLGNKTKLISDLASLNSQYSTQGMNAIKTKLAGLEGAAGIASLPSTIAAAGAKTALTKATAYKDVQDANADVIKAHAAQATATLKAQGINPAGNTPAAAKARSQIAGSIFTTIAKDPRVFTTNPATGAISVKSKKQAITDVAAMLLQSGFDPSKGIGQMLGNSVLAQLGISPTG